jgi:agmatine deiminase
MRHCCLIGLVLLVLTPLVFAQVYDDDGNLLLPRGPAPFEQGVPPQGSRTLTEPPSEPVRATAEWEEVEAIMVRWPNSTSWNLLWSQFLAPVALDLKIYVICASASQATTARNYFLSHGVPVDSMEFPVQATNSVWIRDYGPWWVWRQTSHDRGMVDWIYNRPRPQDDAIPQWQATLWGIPYFGPNLIFTGGNFMVDGWGRGFCSELVLDENVPGVDTRAELDSVLGAFMNLDTMYTFPRFFGIDHIDMSMKLLNDHTAILNQYPAGDAFNSVMDSCEEILSGIENPWGQPVTVNRIATPTWGGGTAYTYTNAIFVNRKVLLPIYSRAEDAAAISTWQSLLPGYTIHGFDCNSIIGSQGAIHCVVKEVVHRFLIRIEYPPLPTLLQNLTEAAVQARVVSLGTLYTDSLLLYSATNPAGPWQTTGFTSLGNDHYTSILPTRPAGVPVYYYVRAKNTQGNWTTMPRYGPEAHYVTEFAPAPPRAPEAFVVYSNGADVSLQWQPVTLDTYGLPIGDVVYNIYASDSFDNVIVPGNLLGSTSATGYTIVDGASSATRKYYAVVAERP